MFDGVEEKINYYRNSENLICQRLMCLQTFIIVFSGTTIFLLHKIYFFHENKFYEQLVYGEMWGAKVVSTGLWGCVHNGYSVYFYNPSKVVHNRKTNFSFMSNTVI